MWKIFSLHALGPLEPEHCLNTAAYASIAAMSITLQPLYAHPASSKITKLKSPFFFNMTVGLHLSQTEHRWDVVKQEIHIVDVQPSICSN